MTTSDPIQILACVGESLIRELEHLDCAQDSRVFQFVHIRNPKELLESHASTAFDSLLLEDGIERFSCDTVTRPIRGELDIRPIIVIGTSNDALSATRAIRAGADDYLVREQLSIRAIREALRSAKEAEFRRRSERDLRQVLAQLKAAECFSQLLIEQSSDMIIAVDLALRITEFNPAAERAFGYHRPEMIGQHVSALYADPDKGWPIRLRTFKSGFIGEVHNRRKTGESFVSALHACKVVDKDGEIVGVLGISREVRIRKASGNEPQDLHEQSVR